MKSFMLSGCAAFALVAGCGAALADTAPGKFDIKIGGDAFFEAGALTQQSDVNTRTFDFANRFRLQITPTAKADNGIEYGANLRILATQSNAVIRNDLAYLFVNGNFGSVQAGVASGPDFQYYVGAPNNFGTGGIDGDWAITPLNAGGATWIRNQGTFLEPYFGGGYNAVTNNNYNQKINYFTPRFFSQGADNTGLIGWASYAPNNNTFNTGVNRSTVVTGTSPAAMGSQSCYTGSSGAFALGCNYQDMYEVGARYDGTFNGVTLAGNIGYIGGTAQKVVFGGTTTSYNDLSAIQVGVQVGYAGFLVGGAYANAGKSAYTKAPGNFTSDQETWTAGISYETGPVVVGFNYQHGKDAGDTALPGNRTADLYSVGLTYTLAPGLTTAFEYLKSNTNNEAGFTSYAASGDADLFLWKTAVTF